MTAGTQPQPDRAPLSIGRQAARLAVELVPPFVVAVLILPYVIAYGKPWPWQPSTIDLQVYVYAVKDMLAGKDIFLTTTPFWHLYFIYPPIAAVLMTPLAFGPYVMWQLIWTAGLIWAQQSVLRRCGVPRGWKLGLIGVGVVLAVEPIRTTLGYGQVNTMLMAFVVADLLPDAPVRNGSGGERRWIPQGVLTGLAAAIKLTPALFVVFMFLIGKSRAAITAMISFVAFTAIGAIFLFSETVAFWTGLSGGDTRTASPLYTGNQSLLGVFYRLGDSSRTTTLLGLGIAGIVALLGVLVAAHWWRSGEKVLRGRAGRAVHQPRVTAFLDPPLRLDPAAGCRGAAGRHPDSGLDGWAASGSSGYARACRCRAALRRRPGAAFRRAATVHCQHRAGRRRRAGRRARLAAGGDDPAR